MDKLNKLDKLLVHVVQLVHVTFWIEGGNSCVDCNCGRRAAYIHGGRGFLAGMLDETLTHAYNACHETGGTVVNSLDC